MIGHLIGGCRVVEVIGQGGFGTVYKAVQTSLDRVVAVKVLQRKAPESAEALEAFTKEARLAAKLNHPNIIRVYNYGSESGVHYIVMECISGETLDKVMSSKGPFPVDKALGIAHQMASALDYAHRQGVVHSDLNPGNVIMAHDGRAVVSDFFGWRPDETMGKNVFGVPEYVSPEQARGFGATSRSDMYSLGVILYEMLTGKPPFSEQLPSDTLFKQVSSDPEPPRNLRPEIPAPLNSLIMDVLAKSPEQRPEHCGDVAKQIDAIRTEIQARSLRRKKSERAPVNRLLVGALILVLGGIGGIGYFVQQSIAQERRLDALAVAPVTNPTPEASSAVERSVTSQYSAYMHQGQTLLGQHDYRGAATAFHRACKTKPNEVDPHLYLSSIFIERGDYGRARSELGAIFRLDPDNHSAMDAMNFIRSRPGGNP